jgi:hypothetical protein
VDLVRARVGDQRAAVRVVDRVADLEPRVRQRDARRQVLQREETGTQSDRRDERIVRVRREVVRRRARRRPDPAVGGERVLAGLADDQERGDREQLLLAERTARDELGRIGDAALVEVAIREDRVDVLVGQVRERVELAALTLEGGG